MLTAYLIVGGSDVPTPTPAPIVQEQGFPTEGEFVGCYEDSKDSRALNLEGKNLLGDMTNEVSWTI